MFENLLISSPNGGGLFLINEGVPCRLDNLDSTGLSYREGIILRGLQPAELCIYDNSARLITGESVGFYDVHDVYYEGGFIYLVDTSGNGIIKLTQTGEEVQRWVFPGEKDSWHINCITNWNGRMVFSAFAIVRSIEDTKTKARGQASFRTYCLMSVSLGDYLSRTV